MQEILLQTVGFVYLVGIVLAGDFSHFTWWNVLLFTVYCGMGPRRAYLHLTVFVLNLCVVVVVLGMSATQCRLLGNAYRAWGPWGYGLGNLLLQSCGFGPVLGLQRFDKGQQLRCALVGLGDVLLHGATAPRIRIPSLMSKHHKIYMIDRAKVSINSFDSKRY